MSARPLVIRVGALGDSVMTLPLIRRAAAHCGEPCDVIGHPRWMGELTREAPWVGHVKTLGSTKLPPWLHPDLRRLRHWLREREPGPIIIAEHRKLAHQLVAGLDQVTTIMDHDAETIPLHQVEKMEVLATAAGLAPCADSAPAIPLAEFERDQATRLLAERCPGNGPLVSLQLGSNYTLRGQRGDRERNVKWWPLERWVTALRQIHADLPQVRFIGHGAPSEAHLVTELKGAAPELPIVNMAHEVPVRLLCAVLAASDLMLSVDTGPAHVAAAVHIPVVVLFGATDPRINRPWAGAKPVVVLTGPDDAPEEPGEDGWARHHRIDAIEPERVAAAVVELLT